MNETLEILQKIITYARIAITIDVQAMKTKEQDNVGNVSKAMVYNPWAVESYFDIVNL